MLIRYAQSSDEQCERALDCALTRGHPGDCYMTAWLVDSTQRAKLRAARGIGMVRDSILRCLDRLSGASNSVNALVEELCKKPLTIEETRWLFFGIGQLLPQYFDIDRRMAMIVSVLRDKLEQATFEFVEVATQALKEGMQSSARKPPNV